MKWISRSAIAFVMLTGAMLPTMAQPYIPWHPHVPQSNGFPLGIPDPPPATAGGVLVKELATGSPAVRAGIRPGDVIVKINGNPISSWQDIKAYQEASRGRPLTLDINRRGAHLRVRAAPTLTSEKGWWEHPATGQDVPIKVKPFWSLGLMYPVEGFVSVPCEEMGDCYDDY
jgi:membrane-associated protease RseP (regulator of RpoE activity)